MEAIKNLLDELPILDLYAKDLNEPYKGLVNFILADLSHVLEKAYSLEMEKGEEPKTALKTIYEQTKNICNNGKSSHNIRQ